MLTTRRGALLGALALPASGALAAAARPPAARAATSAGQRRTRARAVTVYDPAQLVAALAAAVPGDAITLAPGTYVVPGGLRLAVPNVALRSQDLLGAVVRGPGLATSAPGVLVDGLAFDGGNVQLAGDGVRLTNCRISGPTGIAVSIAGGRGVEVGFCEIVGFHGRGIGAQLGGRAAPTAPWIHHNHIHDANYDGLNGEGIQLAEGMAFTKIQLGAIVEYNLMERVEAESEAISVKCSANTIRFNTLQDSRAYISNRHGRGNVYVGNTVQRAYGISVQGYGTRLIGNRCVSSADKPTAIRLLCGDGPWDASVQGMHPAAAATFLSGNESDFLVVGDQFDARYAFPVEDTLVAGHRGPMLLRNQIGTSTGGAPVPLPTAVTLTAADVGPGAMEGIGRPGAAPPKTPKARRTAS